MSARPELKPGRKYALRRLGDRKFLAAVGWSLEWHDEITRACPVFTYDNLTSPQRRDDWHVDLWHRCNRGKLAKKDRCTLVDTEFPDLEHWMIGKPGQKPRPRRLTNADQPKKAEVVNPPCYEI